MQTSQQMSPADQMAKLQQQNMQARQLVLKQAYPMVQSIFSTQIQPNTQPNLQVPPQNVGLIRGFLVKLSATITNPAAGSSQLNITPFGLGNLIQNFIFTDLQNYQRINGRWADAARPAQTKLKDCSRSSALTATSTS